MTALPNHTCFTVLNSFGVELPHVVIDVKVIKINLSDADKYSRYSVLVNDSYSRRNVSLANMGTWKAIGMAKSDAENTAKIIDVNSDRYSVVCGQLKETKSPDKAMKLIREHNYLVDFFANYNVNLAKKIKWDFAAHCISIIK